jgi:DNA-binding NarL/FixJ family response regulator
MRISVAPRLQAWVHRRRSALHVDDASVRIWRLQPTLRQSAIHCNLSKRMLARPVRRERASMGLKVLIADDHQLFRSGLRQLLMDELDAEIVREASTLDEAIDILTAEGPGDLTLLDLRMPGMSGVEALTALCEGFPETRVAVISAWQERSDILSALSAGVHGFVPKSLSSSEIAAALRDILEGRIYVPPSLRAREGESSRGSVLGASVDKLTARQKDVLEELLKGRASKEIARTLDIAEGTVKIHLAAIYRALGVRTRAEAITKLKSA